METGAPTGRRILLLLTATVDVGSTPFVSLSSPTARLEQYARALRWYAESPGHDGIIFCESSKYPLERLRAAAGNVGVEFLQPTDGVGGVPRGKGYGELNIIRHALAESKLLARAREDAVLVKVTGRYIVRNIDVLAASLRRYPATDVVADLTRVLTSADTRVCAFRPEFARRYLLPQQEFVDDVKGYYLEHAFARAVHLGIADGARWEPWRIEPDIDGASGSAGPTYRRGPIRRAARAMMRKMLWLGLAR